jgi:hypothetical protein
MDWIEGVYELSILPLDGNESQFVHAGTPMVRPIGLRRPSGLSHPQNENGLPDEWIVHFQNI